MSCIEYQSALSELVDGTLAREARRGLEAHLEGCAECRAVLADLRRIRESARALPKRMPPESAWQKVRADFEAETAHASHLGAAAISASGSHVTAKTARTGSDAALADAPARVLGFRARSRKVFVGLAAAAGLVLATASGVYFMTRQAGPAPRAEQATAHAQPTQSVQTIDSELELANQHYEKAIAGLETMAKDGQAALDPQIASVLQKNIGIIDQAIGDSRAALRSQPTSEVAQASLFEALQRKVSLLRDTIALINEMRKGDQAGAAKIVGNLGKKS
jgi:anti-sigma factor RsiW